MQFEFAVFIADIGDSVFRIDQIDLCASDWMILNRKSKMCKMNIKVNVLAHVMATNAKENKIIYPFIQNVSFDFAPKYGLNFSNSDILPI